MAKIVNKLAGLPKAEQKVLVAKDVLNQIKAGKYSPKHRTYIDTPYELKNGMDIQENFGKIKDCNVCAMGACLLSIAKFKDGITFGEANFDNGDKSHQLLKSVFSNKELAMIEKCFDLSQFVDYDMSNKDDDLCDKYYTILSDDVYMSSEDMMKTIMKNIIRNKGKFIPKQDIVKYKKLLLRRC